jgi:hypothetical protein
MIPKSGNRFSEKITLNQKGLSQVLIPAKLKGSKARRAA